MAVDTLTTTRYRRMPRLEAYDMGPASDAARQRHCDRADGHVLVLQEGEIVCTACNAVWRDEGF